MDIIVVLHHVALLHKVLITGGVDALEGLLLSVNLEVILELVIAQESGVTACPRARIGLRMGVHLIDVHVNVVLPLRGKVAVLVLALEEFLARVQCTVNYQATVSLWKTMLKNKSNMQRLLTLKCASQPGQSHLKGL